MPYYSRRQLDQTKLHFIIGSNRSGTTLLTTILNAHPNVLSTPEIRIVMALWERYASQSTMPDRFCKDVDTFSKLFFREFKGGKNEWRKLINYDHNIFHHLLPEEIRNLSYEQSCVLLLKNIYLPNKSNDNIDVVVDKNPNYTFYVQTILDKMPNAKFIAAIRDPRATVLSNQQSNRNGFNLIAAALQWQLHNDAILMYQKKYPQNIHLISYEKLVEDTKAVILEMCDFLEIPFHDNMLNHAHQKQSYQTSIELEKLATREQKIIGELTKPINSQRLDAWKAQLTSSQINQIAIICSSTAQQLGYMFDQKPNMKNKFSFYLKNFCFILRSYITIVVFTMYYYRLPISIRFWLMKNSNIGK